MQLRALCTAAPGVVAPSGAAGASGPALPGGMPSGVDAAGVPLFAMPVCAVVPTPSTIPALANVPDSDNLISDCLLGTQTWKEGAPCSFSGSTRASTPRVQPATRSATSLRVNGAARTPAARSAVGT